MNSPRDPRTLEGLFIAKFGTEGHQARHFLLCDPDFLAPQVGERRVGDPKVGQEFVKLIQLYVHVNSPKNPLNKAGTEGNAF